MSDKPGLQRGGREGVRERDYWKALRLRVEPAFGVLTVSALWGSILQPGASGAWDKPEGTCGVSEMERCGDEGSEVPGSVPGVGRPGWAVCRQSGAAVESSESPSPSADSPASQGFPRS